VQNGSSNIARNMFDEAMKIISAATIPAAIAME